MYQYVVSLIRKVSNNYKIVSGGNELRLNCPWCHTRINKRPDTKGHLHINTRTLMFFCHRCEIKGNRKYLLKLLNLKDEVELPLMDWMERINAFTGRGIATEIAKPPLERFFHPVRLDRGGPTRSYLNSRDVSDEDIQYYNVGYADGRLLNRAIFPCYMNNELAYWVARAIYPLMQPKYLNAKSERSLVLFNYDHAKEFKHGFVTEGVISSIIAGRNSVATLGKYVTNQQIALLKSLNWERYYVMLDGDALSESLSVCRRLASLGCEAVLVRLPFDQDPASLGRDRVLALAAEGLFYTSNLEIKLKLESL